MTIFKGKMRYKKILIILLGLMLLCQGCGIQNIDNAEDMDSGIFDMQEREAVPNHTQTDSDSGMGGYAEGTENILSVVPQFSGEPYVEINNNVPGFTPEDKENRTAFEHYSELDELGRCGVAYANICQDIMPTEERGEIGQIRPSGWHLIKYDIIDGNYLYNRCHLIAYQLAGENANEKNLITGTRYLNVSGMLPFENEVADYVRTTGNHVLYRVTPIYNGDDLVAAGVQMEAYSVEDNGAGICCNVFVYNSQPGISIDYATGESRIAENDTAAENDDSLATEAEIASQNNAGCDTQTYVVNTNTKRFHLPVCTSVDDIKDRNKKEVTCSREELIDEGYIPCKRCMP